MEDTVPQEGRIVFVPYGDFSCATSRICRVALNSSTMRWGRGGEVRRIYVDNIPDRSRLCEQAI